MMQAETAPASSVALRSADAHRDPQRKPGIPYVLEACQLCFRRGHRTVIQDVDLTIAPGEALALLGANGAGKTTLLQCLAGALRPMSGEVRWCGEPAGRKPASRRRIGFVGHESGLYLALTSWENLLFAGRLFDVDRLNERTTDILSAIGLAGHTHQQVGSLSRGMRQRLAIARATIHQPEIVILDEPFTSLDAGGRRWLAEYLCQLRAQRCGIVFSSHEVSHARNLVDRALYLQSGRVQVWEGECGDLPASDELLVRSKT